jgi:hypothetical protein
LLASLLLHDRPLLPCGQCVNRHPLGQSPQCHHVCQQLRKGARIDWAAIVLYWC